MIYDTVLNAGKKLQQDERYINVPEVQTLKFSKNFISSFLKTNGFRPDNLVSAEKPVAMALAPEVDDSDGCTLQSIIM